MFNSNFNGEPKQEQPSNTDEQGPREYGHQEEGGNSGGRIDPPESPPHEYSIYVSELARGVTDDQLREGFTPFGGIYSAMVVKDKITGATKGFGFVRFHTMNDVYAVLDATQLPEFEDGLTHKLKSVKVSIADPKNTLYIGNIPPEMSQEDLINIVATVGQESVRKFKYANGTTANGWITYRDHDAAVRALKNLSNPRNNQPIPFTVFLAAPLVSSQGTSPTMKVLFVRNMPLEATIETVQELFGGQQIVERVVIPVSHIPQQTKKAHAFVHFFSCREAAAALDQFNGFDFMGSKLLVEWCMPKADPSRMKRRPDGMGGFLPEMDAGYPGGPMRGGFFNQAGRGMRGGFRGRGSYTRGGGISPNQSYFRPQSSYDLHQTNEELRMKNVMLQEQLAQQQMMQMGMMPYGVDYSQMQPGMMTADYSQSYDLYGAAMQQQNYQNYNASRGGYQGYAGAGYGTPATGAPSTAATVSATPVYSAYTGAAQQYNPAAYTTPSTLTGYNTTSYSTAGYANTHQDASAGRGRGRGRGGSDVRYNPY